jgi:hypothetical protein
LLRNDSAENKTLIIMRSVMNHKEVSANQKYKKTAGSTIII